MDKRAGQVGEAVVCHGAGQPRQQSRSLQAAARGRRVGCRVGVAVVGAGRAGRRGCSVSWRRTAQAAEQVPSGRSTRQAGRLQGRGCRCRIELQDRRKTGFVRLTSVASHHIL